jgi:hypothetical protein
MPYIYDRSPGGDRLSVTRCEEHGGLIVTGHAADDSMALPVCVAPLDVPEVLHEMASWAGLKITIEER